MPTPVAERTWLFTCRHTFETTLADELVVLGIHARHLHILGPGLVRAELRAAPPATLADLRHWDPTYALQVLPDAVRVEAVSVKLLADAVLAVALPVLQAAAPSVPAVDPFLAPNPPLPLTNFAWDVHAIVPGQLKGNPNPPLQRRAALVADGFVAGVQARARRLAKARVPGGRKLDVLVQILLDSPGLAWLSASPVRPLPGLGSWPSTLPAGLAEVPDDPLAPASSFRKLVEAFACMDVWPQPGDLVVDLGASPGGWTRVVRALGVHVTAVDRAELAPHLMADPGVTFVKGDAFAWTPERTVDWLVSDVVAFPERMVEFIDTWCRLRLARRMVVQMKFKRGPDRVAMAAAQAAAERHGYSARARHFFNDKNEVTWMVSAGVETGSAGP